MDNKAGPLHKKLPPLPKEPVPGSRMVPIDLDSLSGTDAPSWTRPKDTSSPSSKSWSLQYGPDVGATVEDLLKLWGFFPQQIETITYNGETISVVRDVQQIYRIHKEVVNGREEFSLVNFPENSGDDRVNNGSGSSRPRVTSTVRTDDIVDRSWDLGYRDWVKRVLRPQLQGSRLLEVPTPPSNESQGRQSNIWWMSKNWKRVYLQETNLGRVVQMQIAVSSAACLRRGAL